MFASLPGQIRRLPEILHPTVNTRLRPGCVWNLLLEIARKLNSQMTGQTRRNTTQQSKRSTFRRHRFLPVRADRIKSDWASRIKEDVVSPVGPGCTQPYRKKFMRSQYAVKLHKPRVP